LLRNCLLKHVISGNTEKKERLGRKCKQLLDDFKERENNGISKRKH
jgi:hypothetical protein